MMKSLACFLLEQVVERFPAQLMESGLPKPSWKAASNRSTADLEFTIPVGGKKAVLLVAVRRNLEPRLARAALFDLNQLATHRPGTTTVLAGTFISPRVRELCRASGVGYFDFMGNVYLRFENVLIDRSSAERPPAADRPLRSVFSWKASRIVRHLLSHPKEAFEVQQLAALCHVSLGLASKVKTLLVDQDYARHSKAGVQVVRPEALLRDWAGHSTYRAHPSLDCFGNGSVASLEDALCDLCAGRSLPFGLALFSGAERVAPMVPHVRGFAYVASAPGGLVVRHAQFRGLRPSGSTPGIEADSPLAGVARELNWKPVPSGANFTLMEPRDESVLWNRKKWLGTNYVVSDIQLYLDLARYPGRGEEAAEQILELRIRPTW